MAFVGGVLLRQMREMEAERRERQQMIQEDTREQEKVREIRERHAMSKHDKIGPRIRGWQQRTRDYREMLEVTEVYRRRHGGDPRD